MYGIDIELTPFSSVCQLATEEYVFVIPVKFYLWVNPDEDPEEKLKWYAAKATSMFILDTEVERIKRDF